MPGPKPDTPTRVTRLLITTDTIGGVWAHSLELAGALAPLGIRVTLAALGGPTDHQARDEAQAIPGLTLYESDYQLPWMRGPWDEVARVGAWLLELCQTTGSDLVHLNEPIFAALPWPVPTLAVGHSCVLSWWEAVHRTQAPREWSRYRAAMIEGLASAGAVVAPSRAMLAQLRRHYGIEGGQVVLNGREAARFAPARKEPVIFVTGRLWDEAKNIAMLDRAAEGLEWPVYAAGASTSPDGIPAPAPLHLRTLGRLNSLDIAAWLGRASIYALPARYEPFGLSILEAALSGCALVLGNIASLREQWNGAACFVSPDDPAALHQTLQELIEDPWLRTRLAQAARVRALRCTPSRMARGYRAAYQELLARPRAAVTARAS